MVYIFVKPEKCTFKAMEVEFLGMTVGTEGIKIDQSKVSTFWNGQLQRISKE